MYNSDEVAAYEPFHLPVTTISFVYIAPSDD